VVAYIVDTFIHLSSIHRIRCNALAASVTAGNKNIERDAQDVALYCIFVGVVLMQVGLLQRVFVGSPLIGSCRLDIAACD
jgi:hypothetical protein